MVILIWHDDPRKKLKVWVSVLAELLNEPYSILLSTEIILTSPPKFKRNILKFYFKASRFFQAIFWVNSRSVINDNVQYKIDIK